MQKQAYGNRQIEARITKTADQAKLVVSQRAPSTGTLLRLFRSTTTERAPLPTKKARSAPITEIFVGTVEAARQQARQIINEPWTSGYTRIIEGWQQLPDGKIQFTIRTLLHQAP
jgi:hypothetical protein